MVFGGGRGWVLNQKQMREDNENTKKVNRLLYKKRFIPNIFTNKNR